MVALGDKIYTGSGPGKKSSGKVPTTVCGFFYIISVYSDVTSRESRSRYGGCCEVKYDDVKDVL